ncbi:MAG TPA: MBL fold metallo-hydrolase [bacterium]|nr:MBL fold metallo-hydrolase [bacterium]
MTPPLAGPRAIVLASGSAGNVLLLEAGSTRLLIDAGLSAEAIDRSLGEVGVDPRALSAILLTHEHDDHARGAGPLSRAFGIPLHANAATAADAALAGATVSTFETGRPFAVGAFEITAFPVSHDAAEPVGFTLAAARHRIVIATDLGSASEALDRHLAGADLVILESNYDLRLLNVSAYPWFLKNRILGPRGHLSNDDAARALARTAAGGSRAICLAHLSEVNNLASLARDTVLEAIAQARGAIDRVLAVPPNGRSCPIVLE